jgi:hypothetical protein
MADAHDLYGLPLERFVSERAALARSLRANGQRDEAARVAKLRKPSVAAWAVNQLVRTQGAAVRELFEAGDALQRAHADLLGGRGNPADLREAADRERKAVEQLSTTARGLLTSEGHELSGTMLERVAETLHAAALDPDARGEVADGCLERELRHVGLGSASLSPAAPSGRTKPGKRTKPDKRADRKRDERLKEARRAAGDARRAAERAVRALRSAEERRDRAIAALDDAEAQVSDARKAVEEAERVRESSERALAELSG